MRFRWSDVDEEFGNEYRRTWIHAEDTKTGTIKVIWFMDDFRGITLLMLQIFQKHNKFKKINGTCTKRCAEAHKRSILSGRILYHI